MDSSANRPGVSELTFAAEAYSIDAIQRAAYRFSDRLASEVFPGESEHRCVVYPTDSNDLEALLRDFRNEVLDQALRERIRSETEPIRTLILAQAFSKTGLVKPPDGV